MKFKVLIKFGRRAMFRSVIRRTNMSAMIWGGSVEFKEERRFWTSTFTVEGSRDHVSMLKAFSASLTGATIIE